MGVTPKTSDKDLFLLGSEARSNSDSQCPRDMLVKAVSVQYNPSADVSWFLMVRC